MASKGGPRGTPRGRVADNAGREAGAGKEAGAGGPAGRRSDVGPEAREEALDRVFFALSDRTRRALLARLAEGEASVSELAAPHAMSLPAVMKHLRILGEAGLTTEAKDGRVRRCQLDPAALAVASDFLATYKAFWEDKFDALERYLLALDEGTGKKDPP